MGNRRVLFSMSRLGSFLISSLVSVLISLLIPERLSGVTSI